MSRQIPGSLEARGTKKKLKIYKSRTVKPKGIEQICDRDHKNNKCDVFLGEGIKISDDQAKIKDKIIISQNKTLHLLSFVDKSPQYSWETSIINVINMFKPSKYFPTSTSLDFHNHHERQQDYCLHFKDGATIVQRGYLVSQSHFVSDRFNLPGLITIL